MVGLIKMNEIWKTPITVEAIQKLAFEQIKFVSLKGRERI
jgi:hypothetical protein